MIPIRFERGLPKTKRRGVTPRRLAAAKRALKRQRDKYPLLREQLGAKQPTPEQRIWNMDTKFVKEWDAIRQATCKQWLELRRIIRKEVCPDVKNDFLVSWRVGNCPADPYYALDFLLILVKKKCTVCPMRVLQLKFKCLYNKRTLKEEGNNER